MKIEQTSTRCCTKPVRYDIVYNCGPNEDQHLLLCSYHYNLDKAFQRNHKEFKEINND